MPTLWSLRLSGPQGTEPTPKAFLRAVVLRVVTYGDLPSKDLAFIVTPRNYIYLYQPQGSELKGNHMAPRTGTQA